jgi:(p)ppGpp synthase/HD superfamily hydrolase
LLYHPEREIDVQWASNATNGRVSSARVDVDMVFRDRADMLASITQVISSEGSNILSCQLRTDDNATGTAALTIGVRDTSQLGRILDKLLSISGMLQVERRRAGRRSGR